MSVWAYKIGEDSLPNNADDTGTAGDGKATESERIAGPAEKELIATDNSIR